MSNQIIKIAIDTLGGDYGLKTTLLASLKALATFDDLHLILVGQEQKIIAFLKKENDYQQYQQRIEVKHTTQVIAMDESPVQALKRKQDSSMYVAVKLVKQGLANACVSAGNTGALMAISKYQLKMIPGINRPAIFGKIPTTKGQVYMLDLGANVEFKPQNLLEFAIMGSVTISQTRQIARPTVGLLNVGSEKIKGSKTIKESAQLLSESPLINYVGFVEGNDIYNKKIDLIVTDGFTGNITLKASEGVADMMVFYLKQSFNKNILTKLFAIIARFVLKDYRQKLDPRKYNGASFLGLQGLVIKSHGSADDFSFFQAIKEARLESYANVPQQIQKLLKS